MVRAGATALLMAGALGSLTRVFTTTSWIPGVAMAVLLALLVVAGIRRIGFGAVAAAIASLVGLAVFVYVRHLPPGPLIPGTEQLSQAIDLFREGTIQFRDEPAPTVPLDGLLLIVTLTSWGLTHVTHELLVRVQRPGLALLAPTALWAVPLAVPLPPGRTWPQTVPFLAAAATVLLLESDADIAGWTRGRGEGVLSTTGATLGIVAVSLAAIAPGLLPGYEEDPWIDLGGLDDPRGYQPIVDVGDRLKLPAERDILRVQSDRRLYLRLAALDTFDGTTWKLGPAGTTSWRPDPSELHPADEPVPPETPIGPSTTVNATVEVLDLENIYVPVPYQPVQIGGDGSEDMVYSEIGGFVATADLSENELAGRTVPGVVPGLVYEVEAEVPQPTIDELANVQVDPVAVAPYLQLPRAYPRIQALATEVYEQADAQTAVDRAFALQRYFAGENTEFVYSTDVDVLRGDGALETFLFETRTGYCEYYATAMAVMLRSTGVPARVSVGFLGGRLTQLADPAVGRMQNTYTVSTADAHAWVEVLFPGYGWVRFEPTPRSDGQVQVPTRDQLDPVVTEAEREQQGQDTNPDAVEETPDPTEPGATPTPDVPRGVDLDDPASAAGGGSSTTGSTIPLVAVALLLMTGAGALAASWYRRPRHPHLPPGPRVLAAQRRLLHLARGYGVGRRPSETTAEIAQRWVSEGRVDEGTAASFVDLVDAAAFGGVLPDDAGERAEHFAERLENSLKESISPRDRLLAPVREPMDRLRDTARDVRERVGS